jgi:hypothetical protein
LALHPSSVVVVADQAGGAGASAAGGVQATARFTNPRFRVNASRLVDALITDDGAFAVRTACLSIATTNLAHVALSYRSADAFEVASSIHTCRRRVFRCEAALAAASAILRVGVAHALTIADILAASARHCAPVTIPSRTRRAAASGRRVAAAAVAAGALCTATIAGAQVAPLAGGRRAGQASVASGATAAEAAAIVN